MTPNFSSISKSFGSMHASSFQLNEFNIEPNIAGINLNANGNTGHVLLPAPNGIISKSFPRISNSKLWNLSGLNTKASSQKEGSRPIAHALTSTSEPFGMI
ncbi:hypothetical protein RDI58_023520 [Solanum bulbocastanum]|uniref:Uncharacterized protein n=1 Tax=Solanum bulbocastanum TaxID=147425 RepID=A0AAN8T9R0_SOLBU